jgi:hypothetical protein
MKSTQACSPERQEYVYRIIHDILMKKFTFETKEAAVNIFMTCASISETGIIWQWIQPPIKKKRR